MKKNGLIILSAACLLTMYAQERLYIHKSDKMVLGIPVTTIDSITFGNNDSEMNIHKSDKTVSGIAVSGIDSISFADITTDTITITYSGSSVTVDNPYENHGIAVTASGADVVINSSIDEDKVNYLIKGTTTDGSLKIYSGYKFDLLLNGVSITNADGPAINIQSGKKCTISLGAGTTNSLTDGTTYTASTEDQKAAFFSEGQLEFEGTGSLTVRSNAKHGICSDDYIQIGAGNITVSGAAKDGIHANDYFKMSGGTLNVTATGDGVDCEGGYINISDGAITTVNSAVDAKGISCDSSMVISGGTINLTMSGNTSKGLRAKQNMTLSGGDITVNTSGGMLLTASGSGYDISYAAGIKADSSVTVNGANVIVKSTGVAGKGISADKDINVTAGSVNVTTSGGGSTYKNISNVTDSYSASCFSADRDINITGGTVTASGSGAGGKVLNSDGKITIGDANNSPTLKITTTGAKFLVSGTDYCHPKTIVAAGAITINNGTSTIASTDDGIHSDASITQNGGSITINNSTEGVESKYIYMNAGVLNLTASNDGVNATMGTVAGGTESNDGSCLYINGGTLIASCTSGDAIDSNGNIVMTGGVVIANGPNSGVEEAVDFNGSFNVKGGLFIGAGSNSNMTKSMTAATSTQPNMYITSSSVISSGSLLHIQNASGTDMLTFKPKYGGYKFLFSSSALTKGASYSIYTGGSYSGGTSDNGLYSGGTYSTSGATLKTTKTLSTSSTVNTISF